MSQAGLGPLDHRSAAVLGACTSWRLPQLQGTMETIPAPDLEVGSGSRQRFLELTGGHRLDLILLPHREHLRTGVT